MKASLIGATINEIDAVRSVIPNINPQWLEEIIIVDGGSTDGTVQFCEENGCRVVHQKSKGYGNAIMEGVKAAKGDIIIEFPPDGNSLPEKIPEVIAEIEKGYDFVIVSRYKDGAKSYDDDWLTAIGNWGFTAVTNKLFGTSYTDVLVGYRAYRKELFPLLDLDVAGLSWPLQEAVRFARAGYRVGEIPGDEPKRIGGTRKMRPFRVGTELIFLIIREYKVMKNDQRQKQASRQLR